MRRAECKIYNEHKAHGFLTDVSGRPKDCCPAAQFGHIGPLASSCRAQWKPCVIYSAGMKDSRYLTSDEAEMLIYGSTSSAGNENRNSLFTDPSNFILADNDGCWSQDPSYILAPIQPFKDQLETDGRPLSALVLARDSTSLALPGFLAGKYETLDPQIESDRKEIDIALDGLEQALKKLISLYRNEHCASYLKEKKYCPEVRAAFDRAGEFRGFKFVAAGDRLFMKITFSAGLKRGQPYPSASIWQPCPNLGFLALRNTNAYVNCLYRMGLIPTLPYDDGIRTALLVPVCMDVKEGTRSCSICRRFVSEHVHGEVYYTSESGDDRDSDSSDGDSITIGDKDQLAMSGSSTASLRDTTYMDRSSLVELGGC